MNKKNFKKAGVGLLVSALFVGGAYAFLKNTETATKTNQIKPGSLVVEFADGTDVITLTGNETIPMTADYAFANLTPYSFKVKNKGSIDAKYNLKLVMEDGSTIDPSLVEVLLNPETQDVIAHLPPYKENGDVLRFDTREEAEVKMAEVVAANVDDTLRFGVIPDNEYDEQGALVRSYYVISVSQVTGTRYVDNNYTHPWVKLSDVNLVSSVSLNAGGETNNVLFARIIENATNTDVLGKNISFHLELDAVQYNGLEYTIKTMSKNRVRLVSDDFATATLADFTSFKVNGIEYVGTNKFVVMAFRNQVGTDTDPSNGLEPPEALIEGINTITFTYKGKEYSAELDLTPAYKVVSWYDTDHNLLKQVKYSLDDVELEVLTDGDISTATEKTATKYTANGQSVNSSSEIL